MRIKSENLDLSSFYLYLYLQTWHQPNYEDKLYKGETAIKENHVFLVNLQIYDTLNIYWIKFDKNIKWEVFVN